MLHDFKKDLEAAKDAELLTLQALADLTTLYSFEWVGDRRECRYKGDILATSANGEQFYIEVKNDKCIATTGNILCEEENYIKEDGRFIKGNMYAASDYFAVVSEQKRVIYIFDFQKLKSIYRKGEFKVIPHAEQDTYCYLLPFGTAKKYGALMHTINY